MIQITKLVEILEEARILNDMLEYIDYIESKESSLKALIEFQKLMNTDATSFNIRELVNYIEKNSVKIREKHLEIIENLKD